MIMMQYKIGLPADYDMQIIRKRAWHNGHKTDDFPDLLFKAYLISEKETFGNLQNSYAPLYVWKDSPGMNTFLLQGPYDAILSSFGWQKVELHIPLAVQLPDNFSNTRYVMHYTGTITPAARLTGLQEHIFQQISLQQTIDMKLADDIFTAKTNHENGGLSGYVVSYSPERWEYSSFLFLESPPVLAASSTTCVQTRQIYEVLHLSLPS